MADTLTFTLVSPEKMLAEMEADEIVIPGANGDMTAKPNHAPLMTNLRPGLVQVVHNGAIQAFGVIGGFAEISPEGVTVLAEEAVIKADFTRELLAERIAQAQDSVAAADGHAKEAAQERLNDLRHLEVTFHSIN